MQETRELSSIDELLLRVPDPLQYKGPSWVTPDLAGENGDAAIC